MQTSHDKITIVKKSDREGRKALSQATRDAFLKDTKPFHFDRNNHKRFLVGS